ncbi:hypothetical protein GGR98_000988 [Parageobacillus caldoxylosilyticus]|nr:hypothetical protein [Parageobacillus caldoxylosilyticus]
MQRGGHFLYEEAFAHLSKDRHRWLACRAALTN